MLSVAVLACLTVGLGQAVPAHRTLNGRGKHPAGRLGAAAAGPARAAAAPRPLSVCRTVGPRTICRGRQVAYQGHGAEWQAQQARRWHARYVQVVKARNRDAHVWHNRLARLEQSASVPWSTAHVTAYASFEALTGCHTPGVCYQACGGTLNDRAYTVASNPSLGLACGTRIIVCGSRCVAATVEDRTASSFDMEFSYALALATGASSSGWDSPRNIRWRIA